MHSLVCFALLILSVLVTHRVSASKYDFENGKAVTVHLFNWRFTDIQRECTEFLGPNGFAAVQVSPPQEHVNGTEWYIHYQPVSYKIGGRLGTEDEFKSMVQACNNAGVHVIVDAVINHMAAPGRGNYGSLGSYYRAESNDVSFPAVPYSNNDFHSCNSAQCPWSCDIRDGDYSVNSYDMAFNVRQCRLVGLSDLMTDGASNPGAQIWVISKIREYLNKLIGMGVRGFRIDGAKHMHYNDVWTIVNGLDKWGPNKDKEVFIYVEYIKGLGSNGALYGGSGRVSDFTFAETLNEATREKGANVPFNSLLSLGSFGAGESQLLDGPVSYTFLVNHDTERDNGDVGTFCRAPASYNCKNDGAKWRFKIATAFLITYPFGLPNVLSSYAFDSKEQGPKAVSSTSNSKILSPFPISGQSCANGFNCEHRLSDVYPLVRFRNVVGSEPLLLKLSGTNNNQIRYSFGASGFVAINAANSQDNSMNENWSALIDTTLPPGTYCNIVYSKLSAAKMTCELLPGVVLTRETVQVIVNNQRKINMNIQYNDASRVIALYTDQRISTYRDSVQQVPILFQLNNVYTNFGEEIRIVGNIPELGNWNCASGINLMTDSKSEDVRFKYPNWAGQIYIKSQTAFEWKPVKISNGNCIWGSGSNSVFNPSTMGSTTSRTWF